MKNPHGCLKCNYYKTRLAECESDGEDMRQVRLKLYKEHNVLTTRNTELETLADKLIAEHMELKTQLAKETANLHGIAKLLTQCQDERDGYHERLAETVALAVHWKEQAEQTQGALNEAENMNAAATAAVDATHQLPQENNAADSAPAVDPCKWCGRNKNDSP